MSRVYPEEVTHCAAGVRWFTYLCCRKDATCGDFEIDDQMLVPGEGPLDGGLNPSGEEKHTRDESELLKKLSLKTLANPEPRLDKNASTQTKFHRIVWRHFRGVLKPPFNDEARLKAGFGKDWYEPLQFRPEWEVRGAREERREFDAFFEKKRKDEAAAKAKADLEQAKARAREDSNRAIFLL